MAISIMILGILGLFFLNNGEDRKVLHLTKFLLILPFFFVGYDTSAQLNYSCDLSTYSCEKNWDNNGFSEESGACVGNGLKDNAYGTSYHQKVEMYNTVAVTGHSGGAVTFTAKMKIEDYYGYSFNNTEFNNIKFYYSTTQPSVSSPGTLFHTISSWSSSDDCDDHSGTFNHGSSISNLYICVTYEVQNGGDHYFWIDEISLVESVGPQISTSSSFSSFSTCSGSESSEQSFTVSGANLEADISVSAPTGYEISTTSGSGFGSNLTLTNNSGTVSSTTIYIRVKNDASNGASGNISLTSTNATSVDIATGSATVTPSTDYYVDDNGSNSNSGTSSGSPWLTLSHAISQAGGCGTINVADGTYTDDKLDLTSSHNGLTINGAGISSTIFDQSGSGDHFMEIKSSATDITIKNMKIMDYDEYSDGGAINITSGTITLENIHFHNNEVTYSYGDGGAVHVGSGTNVTINKCIFTENESHSNSYSDGSAIYSEASTITITNSLFYDNVCTYSSGNGHVYIDDGTATITNCTFTENGSGSPLYLYAGTSHTIKNTLFYNNTSTYDVYENYVSSPYPEMDNSYYENRYGSYNTGSESGNLTQGTVGFTDVANNDFSIGSNSVCVDAGTATGAPTTDINGVTRSSVDIGCYEYVLPQWTGGASNNDWNDGSNWNTGVVPNSTNSIVIPSSSGSDPIITGSISASDLTIESGGEMVVSGSGSLTLSGDLIITGSINYTSSGSITLTKNGGTLSGTGSQTGVDYVIANGGSYTLNDSWSIDNIDVNSGGSLTVATTKTLTTNTNLTNGGTLICSGSGNLTVTGDVSLTGTTTMGSGTLDIDGNYTNSGTFTSGTSTFKLSGSSQQTINGTNVTPSYTSSGGVTSVLTEDFENGGNIPTGWTQEYVISTNSWDFDDGSGSGSPSSAYGGSYNALLFATRGSKTKLVTPVIDLDGYTSPTLKFYHAQSNWGGDQDELRIYYKTSSGGSWTLISGAEWTSEVSSWTQRTVSLPSTSSTYYIAFEGYSDYGYGVIIDNIEVTGEAQVSSTLTLSNEFYNVVIDNSNGVDLSTADIGYSNILTLTDGVITTGTDDTIYVESTSSSALPSGSSSSFINGNIKFNVTTNTETYTIPLGIGTASNQYYRVDLVNNNLAGVDYITARMVSGTPNGYDASALTSCNDSSTQAGVTSFKLKQLSTEGHLKLTPNSQPTGGTYGLNFYTANFDKSTWSNNKVAVFKRSEGSTDNCIWGVAGTLPSDNATGRLKSDDYLSFTGANSFSEYGPGGESGGSLPVTLSNFEATIGNGVVELEWTTQSEMDNDYFTVERTPNATNYEDVVSVEGAGNSIVRIDYSATDEEPLYGTSYYRLKQVDYDGTTSYSDLVSVYNSQSKLSEFTTFYDGNVVNIKYYLDIAEIYSIRLYDVSGKLVYNGILNGYVGNNNDIIPKSDGLMEGIYFINITNGNEVFTKNIIIQ
jgi:hypothetical protein